MAGPKLKYARGPPVGLLSNVSANRFPLYKAINLSSGLTREGWPRACVCARARVREKERSRCVNKEIPIFLSRDCFIASLHFRLFLFLSLFFPSFFKSAA